MITVTLESIMIIIAQKITIYAEIMKIVLIMKLGYRQAGRQQKGLIER